MTPSTCTGYPREASLGVKSRTSMIFVNTVRLGFAWVGSETAPLVPLSEGASCLRSVGVPAPLAKTNPLNFAPEAIARSRQSAALFAVAARRDLRQCSLCFIIKGLWQIRRSNGKQVLSPSTNRLKSKSKCNVKHFGYRTGVSSCPILGCTPHLAL